MIAKHTQYLNQSNAAEYVGLSKTMFSRLVKDGRLPPPAALSPTILRWDVFDLDEAMDKFKVKVDGSAV